MPKITEDQKKMVTTLLRKGASVRETVAETGVSRSSVARIRKQLDNLPELANSGRPSALSARDKRKIVRLVNKKGLENAEKLNRELKSSTHIDVCTQTVRRALKSEGYFASNKKKKPLLSIAHRKARMDFAKTYSSWTVEDWKRVIFSDETKVNRLCSDGNQYCWKKRGSALSENHVVPTLKFGGGSIMVWSCFCYSGVGYEKLILGTMNSDVYISILNEEYLETLNYYELEVDETYFQHDNDPKHRSKKTQKWLSDNNIDVLQWPSQSPDLNPIENLWFQVKARLARYPTIPSSSHELWERFVKEWREIPVERCQSLVESMPNRIRAVLKAKGGYIKY